MNLTKTEIYLDSLLPRLGINKKRELVRLLFEIAKRDGVALEAILPAEKNRDFESAKNRLLSLRYPHSFGRAAKNMFYLPKLELEPSKQADLTPRPFAPKKIYIEDSVADLPLARRAREIFPTAQFETVSEKKMVGSGSYSNRTDTLFIHREKYDFVKPCPCSCGVAGCGYNLINLGFGCRFECEYCFLQQYQNLHAILLPANVTDFLARIDATAWRKGPFERPRIGSGEFTDSLVFDELTEYSRDIVPFFRARPHLSFEFKTKSVQVANLLAMDGAENITVAWSVNAPSVVAREEHFTAGLDARLAAAQEVVRAGYKTAFHFDPVVLFDGYQAEYAETVEKIAAAMRPQDISWISVGTLRFSRELKKAVETRFTDNRILDGEFLLGFDGKMRYPEELRRQAYQFLVPLLRQKLPGVQVYVCMESGKIVQSL